MLCLQRLMKSRTKTDQEMWLFAQRYEQPLGKMINSKNDQEWNLTWFGYFSRSSGSAKMISYCTVKRNEDEVGRESGCKTILKGGQGWTLPRAAEDRIWWKGIIVKALMVPKKSLKDVEVKQCSLTVNFSRRMQFLILCLHV